MKEYRNIKVTRKSGKHQNYYYEGVIEVLVKEKKNGLFRIFFNTPAVYVPKKFYTCDTQRGCILIDMDTYFIDACAWEEMVQQAQNIKSEDECCVSPDTEICNTYPVHDIILCHLLDKEGVQALDYCFKKTNKNMYDLPIYNGICWVNSIAHGGYIKFLYNGLKYCYTINLCDRVTERVCLNCKSTDTSEEDKVIKEFEEWFKKEKEKQERKIMAQEICKRREEKYV